MSKQIAKGGLVLGVTGVLVFAFSLIFLDPFVAPPASFVSYIVKSAAMAAVTGLMTFLTAAAWETFSD